MIEKIILDYLTKALGAPCYMEKPKDKDTFVVIEKTGSSEENHIKSATLALQSYAPSLYKAASLNEKVKEAMDSSISLSSISRAKCNSDYNFSNTTTKEYRYQAVYDVVYY